MAVNGMFDGSRKKDIFFFSFFLCVVRLIGFLKGRGGWENAFIH